MTFLSILLAVRNTRRAFKKTRILRAIDIAREADRLDLITTQAAGYGFEIGRGKPLVGEVTTSPENPFLKPNWRDGVIDG